MKFAEHTGGPLGDEMCVLDNDPAAVAHCLLERVVEQRQLDLLVAAERDDLDAAAATGSGRCDLGRSLGRELRQLALHVHEHASRVHDEHGHVRTRHGVRRLDVELDATRHVAAKVIHVVLGDRLIHLQ